MAFRLRGSARLVMAGLSLGLLASACEVVATPEPSVATPTPTAAPALSDPVAVATIAPSSTGAIITRSFGSSDPTAFEPTVGEPFVLDGARSQDDGVVSKFSWRQVSGPTALISDNSSPAPSVVPQTAGTYVFELTTTDANGGSSTETAEVRVEKFNVKQEFGPVRWMAPQAMAIGGDVTTQFALDDSVADDVAIEVQFSIDGGATFKAATMIPHLEVTKKASAATGDNGTLEPKRTVDPDAGALERKEQQVAATPTSTTKDAASGLPTGKRSHTVAWNAGGDLGADAQDVIVRGWNPTTKEAIVGVALRYDPVIVDIGRECAIHPDLWAFNSSLTTLRNEMLDACALRILNEMEAANAITADQADKIDSALRNYTDKAMDRTVEAKVLDEANRSLLEIRSPDKLQTAVQNTSRQFQTLSNILKAKHDAAMNSIRNMR
ncbi:MAG: hypothetical protein O3B65_00885 [Chloroflexi bacterium]|nr:hypothetical protein [Chloroflexota bacterium]